MSIDTGMGLGRLGGRYLDLEADPLPMGGRDLPYRGAPPPRDGQIDAAVIAAARAHGAAVSTARRGGAPVAPGGAVAPGGTGPARPGATAAAGAARAASIGAASARGRSDGILYLGMNSESRAAERAALSATGVPVTAILATSTPEIALPARAGGPPVTFDLGSTAGIASFVDELSARYGVSGEGAALLRQVLEQAPTNTRHSVGLLAAALAPGEGGLPIPSRLVLSGHSFGEDVHDGGGDHAHLRFATVHLVAAALPRAAEQIEAVHFSGCNTGGQVERHDEWQASFPNLRTMWGYAGTAPGAPTGDLRAWAGATRGRSDSDPARWGHSANVQTWSRASGVRSALSLDELRGRAAEADAAYPNLVAGEGSPGPAGDARGPYETYRELASRAAATPAERQAAAEKAEVLLRVRFHTAIAGALEAEHGAAIRAAFAGVGLAPPDLTRLSRREALARITELEARLARMTPTSPPDALALARLTALRTMDPRLIPNGWCH